MTRYRFTFQTNLGPVVGEVAGSSLGDAMGKAWAQALLGLPRQTLVYHGHEVEQLPGEKPAGPRKPRARKPRRPGPRG